MLSWHLQFGARAGVEEEPLDLMAQCSPAAVDRFAEAAATWAPIMIGAADLAAAGPSARRPAGVGSTATALLVEVETAASKKVWPDY